MTADAGARRHRRLLVAGGTTGFGVGAIIDVVIFHLILQTHHLLSGFYDPHNLNGLRTNVMIDGLFLLAMAAITGIGLGIIWRLINGSNERVSTRALVGAVVLGAGVFNVFDGVVDHYVLGLHNVVHGTEMWNPHWIGVSVILLAIGLLLLWSANDPAAT